MSKKISTILKLQLPSGQANPSMVGTSLGPTGVNMVEFCQKFNDVTKERNGELAPATVTIFDDRSYDFIVKQAPASYLIKAAASIKKGSSTSHSEKVAHLSEDQVKAIAERKMPDLNANDMAAAMKIIAGTARSMGITVDDSVKGDK